MTTAATRRRMLRLRKAAWAYAEALDGGGDVKRTAARLKKLSKLIDPEDIVMLVNAWIAADDAAKKPKRRASIKWLLERKPEN